MNTKDLIAEAVALPVEERAWLVDSLLRSLNQPELAIDQVWMTTASHRLTEIRSGAVDLLPGQAVFDKIRKKFER
ncbi:MAG: addiction module protein [Halothiobacillus sp.]